ncbi:MAG: glucokinase [Sandaracinaceae bacterium]|nr:glucokinase [Sandaracinaceae bacterium]
MRILVGDIGGTKTLLALYEGARAAELRETRRERYENASSDGLAPILADFVASGEPIDAAVLGVAGPVEDDVCNATNLPWVIDARRLAAQLAIPRAALINDFEAVALGLDALPSSALEVLQDRPADPGAPRAVLGAGTGLGEAILVPTGGALPRVLPTEGGHVDFAPRDEVEIDLLRFAQARFPRVCVERLVSGPGIAVVYDHIVASGAAPASPSVPDATSGDDRSAAISRAAAAGEEAAGLAIRRFVSLYGAEAGNFALKCLPFGGLYVAGGIAPRMIEALRAGGFIEAFRAKGRMAPLLDRVRVSVVLDPAVGLLGAKAKAVAMLGA